MLLKNKPTHKTGNDGNLIKNRKLFYIALVPFIISMALNFPFPHRNPYGEAILTALNIPIQTVNGFYYVGLASFFLLIASLTFLGKSLGNYQVGFKFFASVMSSTISNSRVRPPKASVLKIDFDSKPTLLRSGCLAIILSTTDDTSEGPP